MTSSWKWLAASILGGAALATRAQAQVLTLEAARARALAASPELVAASAAVTAAEARARQAGAFPNPTISYAREQTSRAGQTSWQNIGLLEQRLDFGGQRGARHDAAVLRRDAAEHHAAAMAAEVRFQVTSAYAAAVAADYRAARLGAAVAAFTRAREISAARRAAGDESGYVDRRIALEAARYTALHAEAVQQRRQARLALWTLLAQGEAGPFILDVPLEDSPGFQPLAASLDSLQQLALKERGDLRALEAAARASLAEATAAAREAFPTPTAGIGFKSEKSAGDPSAASGFAFQLSVPVPLWDGRRGAADAFRAEGDQRTAEQNALRRRIQQEVEVAWSGLGAAARRIEALRSQLGPEADKALAAAATAYTEGEIPLVEWLDAVRAYQEAESAFATVQADYVIQHAALERAVGVRLF